MTQNEEFDGEPAPELRYVGWGHPFQLRSPHGRERDSWAPSANRSAAEVAESHTFKLRNAEGDTYLFTPDPFDYNNVWVSNKGARKKFTTVKAREFWKELSVVKGYMQID